jgi:CRISPR-associated protein Csb1
MNTQDLYDELLAAVGLETEHAAIRMRTTYEPAGGEGSRVAPPSYPTNNGHPYVVEPRLYEGEQRESVLLDSVPSQANRAEEALLRAHRGERIRLPLLQIDHEGAASATLTSLEVPHRYADAYLRDSLLDGQKFDRTEIGKAFLAATPDDATALYRHDPGSIVYGAWNSHRKGHQAKFPRVYSSEVLGWDPALGERRAGRMDPLNLVGAAKPDGDDWKFAASAAKVKGERLSERGHGNVAPNATHGGVTIRSAERQAFVSLAGLDRLGFGAVPESTARAARATLAAYALMADRLAFGRPSLWLRSGCDLVVVSDSLCWVDRGGATHEISLSTADAIALFAHAADAAAKAGLGMSETTVRLTPDKNLADAIDFSLTKAESTEGA